MWIQTLMLAIRVQLLKKLKGPKMTMLANIHFVREKDTKIQYDYSIKVRLSPSKASREARYRLQLPYQCRALLDTLSLLDHHYGLFWIREPKMEF